MSGSAKNSFESWNPASYVGAVEEKLKPETKALLTRELNQLQLEVCNAMLAVDTETIRGLENETLNMLVKQVTGLVLKNLTKEEAK